MNSIYAVVHVKEAHENFSCFWYPTLEEAEACYNEGISSGAFTAEEIKIVHIKRGI